MSQFRGYAAYLKQVESIITGNLVSWWDFRGGFKTGTVVDRVGDNDGTITNATIAEFWPMGKGRSVFDGVDQYANCGNDTSLRFTTEFSLEAWFSLPTLNAAQNAGLIGRWINAGNQRAYTMFYDMNGDEISFNISETGANFFQRGTTNLPVAIDTIHHVVGTFVASTHMRIYFDGVRLVNETVGIPAGVFPSTGDLTLGMLANYATSPLVGSLYVARVYNVALSAAGVMRNYQAERRGYGR